MTFAVVGSPAAATLVTLLAAAVPAAAAQPSPPPRVHQAAAHHGAARLRARRASNRFAARQRPAPMPEARSETGPAPVPDEAIFPPIDDPQPQTSVAPAVIQLHYPWQGDGYVSGSSPQAMDDREAAKVTGIQITVPLQQ
jgi:hypothetical protein